MHTFFFYFKVLGKFSCMYSYCALILMWRHLHCTMFYFFFPLLFCTLNIAATDLSVALVALVALCHHVIQMSFPSSEAEEKSTYLELMSMSFTLYFLQCLLDQTVLCTKRSCCLWGRTVSQNAWDEMTVYEDYEVSIQWKGKKKKKREKKTLQCRKHEEMDFQSTWI